MSDGRAPAASPTARARGGRAARLAIGALLWLWGGVAGALFGGGWPPVAVGQLPGVLIRPAGAPVRPGRRVAGGRARRGCPGAGGFYAALALLAVPAGGAVAVAGARELSAALRGGGGARWARAARAAGAPQRLGARRAAWSLGRRGGRLLYAEQRHALVAFGPPQSGKSAGLAVPALLEWDGPAVASSIKTDLLGVTADAAGASSATVFVFDPFGLAGEPSHTWSPLHAARHLGRRARGRVAAGRGGRARPARRRGRRLLGDRRRAAAGAAAVRGGARPAPGWTASSAGPTARAARELDEALARADRRGRRRARAGRRPRRLRRGARVRGAGRPDALVDRGDRPGAAARVPVRARAALGRARARSPPTGCSTSARRCT